jgi:hypothetical protein
VHDVTLFFPFFHQCQLLCFVSHSNDMTSCQSSLAENVSCNVAPFFYHHSVVIQHLVSDRLLSLISKKMYIMLDKTEISLKVALNIITLTTNIINTLITMSYLHFILTVLFFFLWVYILVIFFRGIKASHILLSADGYVTLTGIRNAYSMIKNGHRLRSVHEYPITCVSMLKWFSPEILSQVKIEN